MSQPKSVNARKASKDALRAIYYVVIGLALKEALSHAFSKNGEFVGSNMFDSKHLPTTLLFFAFLPTAIRFVHGASIHIDALSEKRYKPLFDFVGFIAQASFLYLMAITLATPTDFAWLIVTMLLVDTIWLFVLHMTNFHPIQKTERQWIGSNIVVSIIVGILLGCEAFPHGAWIVTVTAVAAAAFDYYLNRTFYFPEGDR
jgi:hypothetical protein